MDKDLETSFQFSDQNIERIVPDSRQDITNGLFVPIIGEKSDGHDYIDMAIRHGAAAVLSSRPVEAMQVKYPAVKFYHVADTRAALQEIGAMERSKFSGTVIGVTGSVGKTTTRNMIACALSAGKKVFQTAGNANSQVGVPITMFQMAHSGAETAVVELGMSEPGEMTKIATVACVDMAVMTNIGIAHIEQLKTQENILREKLHILDGMRDGGTLFLNGDDPILSGVTLEQIHSYGIAADKNIRIVFYKKGDYQIDLAVKGSHMQENAMAALHAAEAVGIPYEAAADALARFTGLQGRGETFTTREGVTVIDDAYNASPVSMKAGLQVLSGLQGERKIAVLADMLELGEHSEEYHREIGACINGLSVDLLFLYGKRAASIGKEIRGDKPAVEYFDDFTELSNTIRSIAKKGDVVLFKGSNSMRLSDIVNLYRNEKV